MGKLPTHLTKYAFKKGSGPVTAKQAQTIAKVVGKKMPMDPEDMIDKGVDEDQEKN